MSVADASILQPLASFLIRSSDCFGLAAAPIETVMLGSVEGGALAEYGYYPMIDTDSCPSVGTGVISDYCYFPNGPAYPLIAGHFSCATLERAEQWAKKYFEHMRAALGTLCLEVELETFEGKGVGKLCRKLESQKTLAFYIISSYDIEHVVTFWVNKICGDIIRQLPVTPSAVSEPAVIMECKRGCCDDLVKRLHPNNLPVKLSASLSENKNLMKQVPVQMICNGSQGHRTATLTNNKQESTFPGTNDEALFTDQISSSLKLADMQLFS